MGRSERRLARWARCTDAPQLESQLRNFLVNAGKSWPTIRVKRMVLEAAICNLVDALLDVFKDPMPLGEDVLVTAVERLGKDATHDACVARFFEQIQRGAAGETHHGSSGSKG